MPAAVTFYIETDDMQAALDKINLLGGKTETPITELAGMVDLRQVLPTRRAGHRPGARPAEPCRHGAGSPGDGAPVDWFEVLGAGRRAQPALLRGDLRLAGQRGRARLPDGRHRHHPRHPRRPRRRRATGQLGDGYASVPDVEAVLARAVELGGAREYGPNPWTTTCRPARCATRQATCSASTTTPRTEVRG